jgi:hypothetical protein
MDKTMSTRTKKEVMSKLRQRYEAAGREHKTRLIDQAIAVMGYHRKAAIRALGTAPKAQRKPGVGGRPVEYEFARLGPVLRVIWEAADFPCAVRLAAMLPEWIPAYESHHHGIKAEVREPLLEASARTLDRLLAPLRAQGQGRCLTRPGMLLRQQIPIRGSVWEENVPGWLEVDTVALCGGSVAGDFVWMVDGVDYATCWVTARAIWNRGQAATLAALQDMEKHLPFSLLGLDSDNGGEFLNYHVLAWLQQRPRPVFMTRSRPYKKDDNAHVEQKNWTHIRQWFGYQRYENPEVVEAINSLVRGPWSQLLNYFHSSLKLERKEAGKRVYGPALTPLARVLASDRIESGVKAKLQREKKRLNPFELKVRVKAELKKIEKLRRLQKA